MSVFIALNRNMETNSCKGAADASDDEMCPLFMNGLPKDFMKNPQLAALASLINEGDEIDCQSPKDNQILSLPTTSKKVLETPTIQTDHIGKNIGRKISTSRMKRQVEKSCPYWKPTSTHRKSSSSASNLSLGEAQLFLKMWSL
jgi:hypothetical protein